MAVLLVLRLLLKLLYGTRAAWPPSAVVISRLASFITKWNAECDRRIDRLMAFVKTHGDLVLSGRLSSEDKDAAELHVWPDADLVGDDLSTRSTSGPACFQGMLAFGLRNSWSCKYFGSGLVQY